MKIHNFALAAVMAAASFVSAGAQASVYTVEAITPYGSWLDTGISLNSGATYTFTVLNPATIWSAGAETPYSRDSNANGIDPIASGYGTWTMAGFTANYGALVGDAGGVLFLIGTGPTTKTGLSGELTVGYWDSYYGDNSGSQSLQVTGVPEASTWVMMLAGFAGLGFAGFRKSKGAYVAA
jgi:hypothetical protein